MASHAAATCSVCANLGRARAGAEFRRGAGIHTLSPSTLLGVRMGTKQQWNLHQVAKRHIWDAVFSKLSKAHRAGCIRESRPLRNWGIVTLVVQVVAVVGGLPFGATGVAVVVVMTSLLIAVPSIRYAEMVSDILKNVLDRKSTRLNSSHLGISYAVFC